WNLKKGVRSIQLDMTAGIPPRLIIECFPDSIEVDGLEVEAILKRL
ncbi:conserved domain protein, partial [Listeria monocytogenes FSL F2-208]